MSILKRFHAEILPLTVLILGLSLSLQAQSSAVFEKMPEDAIFCVSVENIKQVREKWEDSRFLEAWKSPEFEKIRTFLVEAWKEGVTEAEGDLPIELDEALAQLDGFVAVLCTYLESKTMGDVAYNEWDACLVAEADEKKQEAIQRLVDKWFADIPSDAKKSVEDHRDIRIYTIEYKEVVEAETEEESSDAMLDQEIPLLFQYAFTDRFFVICEGRNKPIRKILNGLQDPEAPSLGASAGYREAKAELGSLGDLNIWVNSPKLLGWVKGNMTAEEADGLDKSGLLDVGSLLVSESLSNSGTESNIVLMMPNTRRGVLSMLYSGEANRLQQIRRLPPDVFTAVSFTLDVGAVWEQVRRLMDQFDPSAAAMINAQITQMQTTFGINVESDLLQNLAGEHLYYARPFDQSIRQEVEALGMEESSSGFTFGLKNAEKAVQAVTKLMTTLTQPPYEFPFEKFTQGGVDIWTVKEDPADPMPVRPALAVTSAGILTANNLPEAQESVRRMTSEASSSIMEVSAFRSELDQTPRENLRLFSYQSPRGFKAAMESLIFSFVAYTWEFQDIETELDIEDVPPLEWWERYFAGQFDTTYTRPNAIVYQSKLLAKQ